MTGGNPGGWRGSGLLRCARNDGLQPRGVANAVIARSAATKQSRGAGATLDCFAPLAMTGGNPGGWRGSGLLRCARNDGLQPRGVANAVIARSAATKQSRGAGATLDCFAPLAMTGGNPGGWRGSGLLRCARNDGLQPRGVANAVIARSAATKQSRGAGATLDCFAPLAMTGGNPGGWRGSGLLRCARNDVALYRSRFKKLEQNLIEKVYQPFRILL